MPHVFLANKTFRTKGLSILIPNKLLYFISLHLKLSSQAHNSQLIEIFAYENKIIPSHPTLSVKPSDPIIVYQFHNLFTQDRIFVYTAALNVSNTSSPKSISELFACSSWLEREVGEMHGICFEGKKDLRNLMLQYGDAGAPFRKSYPSIGVREIFYDSVTDTLVQVPVSLQI
jgi:NADH:ubiquinone oxidoreductase subunit C